MAASAGTLVGSGASFRMHAPRSPSAISRILDICDRIAGLLSAKGDAASAMTPSTGTAPPMPAICSVAGFRSFASTLLPRARFMRSATSARAEEGASAAIATSLNSFADFCTHSLSAGDAFLVKVSKVLGSSLVDDASRFVISCLLIVAPVAYLLAPIQFDTYVPSVIFSMGSSPFT